ncbi:hypothetical protein HDU92_003756 [Lobulomyces angularis]|nr:hypothetical protein HDU92_003756 [Lobulomyces angularis]
MTLPMTSNHLLLHNYPSFSINPFTHSDQYLPHNIPNPMSSALYNTNEIDYLEKQFFPYDYQFKQLFSQSQQKLDVKLENINHIQKNSISSLQKNRLSQTSVTNFNNFDSVGYNFYATLDDQIAVLKDTTLHNNNTAKKVTELTVAEFLSIGNQCFSQDIPPAITTIKEPFSLIPPLSTTKQPLSLSSPLSPTLSERSANTQSSPDIENKELNPPSEIFRCTFEKCNKVFKRKSNLKSHQILHTQKKNFKCNFCYLKFLRKFDLKRHHLKIHNVEIKKSCSLCFQNFEDNFKFSAHYTDCLKTNNNEKRLTYT